ncbi:TPA: hypothetical protein MI400_14865 [Klebsiella pneumoniae]|nr:hypothetical protein [Klebsiella pneumoniae]
MTSKLTKERLQEIAEDGFLKHGESKELARMALAAMDIEPVILYRQVNPTNGMKTYWAELDPEEFRHLKKYTDENAEFMTLYRHAQPVPVVPDDVLAALQKVARIRLDLNDFDGDRRGIADCLGDAEEALIEVVNRRADMLHAGNSPANPDCWCRACRPVTLNDMRFVVCPDCGNKRCPRANDHRNACTGSNEPGQEGSAYPDTPREVKP